MQAVVFIGDKVRELRGERVWTQGDLAERSGVGIATIVRIERNQVEPFQSTIRKLAAAFDVDPSELVKS